MYLMGRFALRYFTLSFFIIIQFFTFCSDTVKAQERGFGNVVITKQPGKTGNSYGLIIGVSKYKDTSMNLKFAANDAVLFKNFLIKSGTVKEENIVELLNEKANGVAISTKLSAIADLAKEGDNIYIYFAGHGDVQRGKKAPKGYLLGYNANSDRVYTGNGGFVDFTYLQKRVDFISSKKAKVHLILDACHSGFSPALTTGGQQMTNLVLGSFNNVIRYLSCQSEQLSYESKEIEQGLFTYYLVNGLMGLADQNRNNSIIVEELNSYVRDQVLTATKDLQQPKVVATNELLSIQAVNPDFLKFSLAATDKKQISVFLAGRSAGLSGVDTADGLTPRQKKYIESLNKLLASGSSGIQEFYTQYRSGICKKELPALWLPIVANALAEALGNQPQEAVNTILRGKNSLPGAAYFLESARLSSQALSVLDTSSFYYKVFGLYSKYLEAYSYLRAKNYRKYNDAEKLLKDAFAIQPEAAFVIHALGMVAQYKADYPLAEKYFRDAINIIPSWTYPRSSLGNVLTDQGRYKEALEVFDTVISIAPDFSWPYNNLANVYFELNRYAEAEKLYRKAIEMDPADASTSLQNLGSVNYDRGNIRKSDSMYVAAIKADGQNSTAYTMLGKLYIKSANTNAGYYLRKAIEIEPFYSEGLTNLADYYRTSPDQGLQLIADSLYNQAILNNPFDTWAYAGRGWNALDQKNEALALSYFKKGVEVNPEKPSAYYYYASYLDVKGDAAGAEANLRKCLALNPYYYEAYVSLSEQFLKSGNAAEAEKWLLKALPYFELSPLVYCRLADFYYGQGNTTQAVTCYNKALKVDSSYAAAFGSLAYAALENGQLETAVKQFRKANLNSPAEYSREDFVAQFSEKLNELLNNKKYAAVMAGAQSYKKIFPDTEHEILYRLGKSLYLLGKSKEAASMLGEISILPGLANSYKYTYTTAYGWALIDCGKYTEALKAFKEASLLHTTPSYIGEALSEYLCNNPARAQQLAAKDPQLRRGQPDEDYLNSLSVQSRKLLTGFLGATKKPIIKQ